MTDVSQSTVYFLILSVKPELKLQQLAMIGLLKVSLSICQSRWKEIWNWRTSGSSLSPLRGKNKDIGTASQTLVTEVKFRLWRRLYGGAIQMSALFILRVFNYKGLKAARR